MVRSLTLFLALIAGLSLFYVANFAKAQGNVSMEELQAQCHGKGTVRQGSDGLWYCFLKKSAAAKIQADLARRAGESCRWLEQNGKHTPESRRACNQIGYQKERQDQKANTGQGTPTPEQATLPQQGAPTSQPRPSTSTTAVGDDQALCRERQGAASIAACTRLMSSNSTTGNERASLYALRGSAYRNERDYDRAIADFTEVIEILRSSASPDLVAAAYVTRATTYASNGSLQNALADYRNALALDSANAQAAEAIKQLAGNGTNESGPETYRRD
jgi:tetratricopeptide (TPR) repeat protein